MSDDDGNSYDGRIWCRDADRDRVNDLKRGGETQADVLERVLDYYENADDGGSDTGVDDVDALADALAERIDLGTLESDDVRAAAERGAENALQGVR